MHPSRCLHCRYNFDVWMYPWEDRKRCPNCGLETPRPPEPSEPVREAPSTAVLLVFTGAVFATIGLLSYVLAP